jgi:hypothetical protein
MADAKNAKIAGRSINIILPGTWANVPLETERVARKFVKDLVRRQVGMDDRLAKVRADMVDETMKNVTAAVAMGVHTYLMSLELLPGVPFPAAILMADEPWPDAARPHLGASDVPRALREGFPGGAVLDQANGPVLRIAEFGESAITETPVNVLRLEYHVPYPGLAKLLYARISVPMLPAADRFVALFDEIIDSVTFVSPDETMPGDHVRE